MSVARSVRLFTWLVVPLVILGAGRVLSGHVPSAPQQTILPTEAQSCSAGSVNSGQQSLHPGPRCFFSDQQTQQLEQLMLELVNQDRLDRANWAHGPLRPVKWDEKLARVARAYSADMVARKFFSHISPEGQSPVERVYSAGILWTSLGENIARNHVDVTHCEAAFMRKNHRDNILNPNFSHVGVGIVRQPDGLLCVTQVFVEEAQ